MRSEDAARLLDELEHLSEHDPLAESAGEPIHGGANVDRPAELVEKRLVLGRRDDGQRLGLPVTIDEPRRHPRRLERGRPLRHVRPADQHALAPEQPNPELLLEPLPLGPSTHGDPQRAAHRHDHAETPACARPTAPTREQPPRTAGHRHRAAAAHRPPTARRSRHRQRRHRRAKRSRAHCTAQHFGPMNSSISATDLRCETEMFRGFDCVHRIPSSSQCSQKMRRMSSERFEKK